MRLQLAFEELVHETLIPALENPDILINIDYSEETEKAAFTVRYGGEQYDPTSQEDQLSLAVLKSTTKEIRYTYLEGSVKQIMKAENCHKESTASGTPYDKRMKI